jgi:hypothetical protein
MCGEKRMEHVQEDRIDRVQEYKNGPCARRPELIRGKKTRAHIYMQTEETKVSRACARRQINSSFGSMK